MMPSDDNSSETNGIHLLLRPPAIAVVNDAKNVSFSSPITTKTYHWNARISFAQQNATSNVRDQLEILFAELQRSDSQLQLLPYEESSFLNPIKASKNIPTDADRLKEYIQIPDTTNRFTKTIHIYVCFLSSQAPSFIRRNIFVYLRKNNIFFQKK